jgi:tRNA(fMet)-specific endonuclease VapC
MAPRRRELNTYPVKAAVVDTDVVSMLFKGDSRAHNYRAYITGRLLGISFMTLAELDRWSLDRSWGTGRKAELETYLRKFTILPATRDLCSLWAKVSWEARKKGRPIQTADAWIAASALYYQVPLITTTPAT